MTARAGAGAMTRRTIACLALLTIGCVSAVRGGQDRHQTLVTERDAGRDITLTTGDTLIVKLRAHLGTGYSWQLLENDASVLETSGGPDTEASENRPGAAEYQVFRFKARKPGVTGLALHHTRAWKPDAESDKRFGVKVIVR